MATILVVDDEEDMLENIAYNLERKGHVVSKARGAAAALDDLERAVPDLIISDIMMPGMDGVAFCHEVRCRPETLLTPFLFVTAKGQVEDKLVGLRAGADDYITKPFDLADLLARVEGRLAHRERLKGLESRLLSERQSAAGTTELSALRLSRARERQLADAIHQQTQVDYAPPPPGVEAVRAKVLAYQRDFPALAGLRHKGLVGEDPAFLAIFEEILIASQSKEPTTILGETGTGKTATAEAIWALGPRAGKAFRTVSCAELAAGDPTIAMGKLFGYGKNSGLPNLPKEGQRGLLEEADGGVLFLDEVAALPPQAQLLLLLPLEGRAFNPAVGAGEPRRVDVKFVLATNRDLRADAEQGTFPRDLYERIAGEVVRLPALRERQSDVELLARHFVAEAAAEDAATLELSVQALQRLAAYAWPGNVRELRRVVRSACKRAALAKRARVEVTDLADLASASASVSVSASASASASAAAAASPAHQVTAAPPATIVADAPGFTERERAELGALRKAGFRLGEAESLLGYKSGSRTLSHRVRGMSLKALSLSRFDVDAAAALLAGGDPPLRSLVARRLRSLLDGMAARAGEPEDAQLRHLLHEHRPFVLEAREWLRRRT